MEAARRPRLGGEQALVEAGLLPVTRLAEGAEHAQVDPGDRLPGKTRQQRGATAHVRHHGHQARRLQDRRLHQRGGYGAGSIEYLPFMGDVVAGVLVVRIDGQLLLAAEHQHRGAVQDQRPQGAQLRLLQRVHRVIGTDRRQDAQGVALGVMQQGRAGYRQVGDAPGAQQVAEVDDPLHLPLPLVVAGPDHVVIGDVQVDCLLRQLRDQGLQASCRHPGDLFDLRPSLPILQHRQQVFDQHLGMARVPLQRTLKARVIEVGERQVNPGTKRAQFGNYPRRQVLEARQRLTVDVLEQSHPQLLTIDVQRQQVRAIAGWPHRRHRQPFAAQVTQRGMLGLELHLTIACVTSLEHVARPVAVETQVQVLLATHHLQASLQNVMYPQQGMSLGLSKHGCRQAGSLNQG